MTIRYRVDLSEAERIELEALLRGGRHAARTLKRAQILLAADSGVPDEIMAHRGLRRIGTIAKHLGRAPGGDAAPAAPPQSGGEALAGAAKSQCGKATNAGCAFGLPRR